MGKEIYKQLRDDYHRECQRILGLYQCVYEVNPYAATLSKLRTQFDKYKCLFNTFDEIYRKENCGGNTYGARDSETID